MEKISPKGTTFDEYKAKNVELRQCPKVTKNWRASEKLPPTPNRELCKCMVKSLSCKASDDLDEKELGELFGTVCGMDDKACAGISSDPKKGSYGAYSMCNPYEQLSHAYNSYYELNDKKDTACDFDGTGETQEAEEAEGECATLIKQAGKDGSGTVTAAPTSADGEGDSAGSAGEGSSAASPMATPGFNFGVLSLSAYLVCAMTAGAGVIFM